MTQSAPPPVEQTPPAPADTPPLPAAATTALLLVDLLTPARASEDPSALRGVAPALSGLIARARSAGLPVLFIDDYRAGEGKPAARATPRAIVPAEGDVCLVRGRPSAFDGSPLEDALRERGISRVILAGRGTEQGLLYSAIDASVRHFAVVVARDGIVSASAELAAAALTLIEQSLGGEVADAAEIALDAGKGDAAPRPHSSAADVPSAPVPSPGQRFAAVHPASDTRQRLVNALAVVISRSGFAGAKITDVATEARASLRTFYSEFSSKEECFIELHRQVMVNIETNVRGTLVFDRPWIEVMRSGFQTYFTLLTFEPRLTRAILHELATVSDEGRQARDDAMEFFGAMLRDMIEQGRAAHPAVPSRPLSELGARAIIGAVIELATSFAAPGNRHTMADMVDTATDMLTSTVLVIDPAAA